MSSKDLPLISVVIPTFNRAELLPRAVRSVLSQTYGNLELLVVNDGSTDNTEDVVRGFSDGRISYIEMKENMGANAARNIGINAAEGQYVAFLDSDDEWLPEKLEKQIGLFFNEDEDLGLVYCGEIVHDINQKVKILNPWHRGDIFELQLFEDHILATTTWLVRKDCLLPSKAGLFDEALKARQDYDLALRITMYFKVDFVPQPLVKIYYESEDQITLNVEKRIEAHLQVLNKVNRLMEEYGYQKARKRRVNANHYYVIARFCQNYGEGEKALMYLKKAISFWPLKYQAIVIFVFLKLGDHQLEWFGKIFRRKAS